MNARSQQKQEQIRTINFHQFVSGFSQTSKLNQQEVRNSSANLSQPSKRPQTSYHQKFVTSNIHPLSGRRKINLNSQSQYQIAPSHDKRLMDFPQYGQLQAEGYDQIERQERRHQEFVKSYHQWLKDTQVEEYQSSRMVTSFALKKTRASLRPRKVPTVFQFKAYQQHFNQEYHPPNLFPSRTHQSLKKMYPKTSQQFKTYKKLKNKNEGELKLQLMKSMAKKDTMKKQKHHKSHNIRSKDKSQKTSTLFMKTFSNPKLLAIQNGQLVTGTKILYIN